MKAYHLIAALFLVGSVTQAFASNEKLAFQGVCKLHDGEKWTEVGKFSLDHDAAVRGECPHAEIEFVLPFSSVKHLVYIEHQTYRDIPGTAGALLSVSQGQQTFGYASLDPILEHANMYLGAKLNAKYFLTCEASLAPVVQ